MSEPLNTALTAFAEFTASGVPVTPNADVTVRVYLITNTAQTEITGGAQTITAISGSATLYAYQVSAGDNDTAGTLKWVFTTTATNVDETTLYAYVSVSAEAVNANVTKINSSATAAAQLARSAATIVNGAATSSTLSTTQMSTDLTEATDNHFNGRIIIWTSGALVNQATDITDYDGASKTLTFTQVTEAPQAADTFIIV